MLEIEKKVLEKIRPDSKTRKRVEETIRELKEMLETSIANHQADAEVLVVGSCARDTYLQESKDIDLFLLFPENLPKDELEKRGIEIGMGVLKGELKYAEHPYVHGIYKGFEVDIVPCYRVKDPAKKLSAVDRTPFHNKYVNEHLKEDQKDEVRLLKRFLKGIGIYGAEAAVQGFSGYLCELLIIKYGSFRGVLESARNWRANVHMWIEKEPVKKFLEPLVFIDPVDPGRNVASAVSLESLSLFIVAAREYLEKPDIKFFFPKKRILPVNKARMEVRRYIEKAGTAILAVFTERPEKVDDIIAPQVKKMERVLAQNLGLAGFKVLRSFSFFTEKEIWIFLELEAQQIPKLYLHSGPHVWLRNSENFLEKYSGSKGIFLKPFVSGGRWVVGLLNDENDALEFLRTHVVTWNTGKDLAGRKIQVMEATELNTTTSLNMLLSFLKPEFPWK
ncbi:MAG: CCA tRNA nucleotidyltransferase [Thermoplasmata archaeon]|nr:CCA tRNA nucleotidyltransferase [Thermoplasmata archaeon]